MSDNKVILEINGKQIQAEPGSMLIEAAGKAGIHIPRFCYHPKLSISANCRMCMVEVERAPKPLPACATPVSEGMKVSTRSKLAIDSQRSAMEFLLINHPLDCPICDQGGECELQDVAMGYGGDVSQYTEGKRVVADPDLGPLISTDLTRCIHCTRCVRFGEEIAGIREMGATGRGEFMTIGTFIEKSIDSELSGNIIDLCPVGALTAKPSRYGARAWELTQHASISAHDSIGSNIYAHSLNGKIARVVPRDNEAVNESWLSDRDRFSYQALNSPDRTQKPMVKENGEWQEVSWEIALEIVNEHLKSFPPEDIAGWLSPQATLEELYLAQKYLRELGVADIDHRFKESDFSDQEDLPLFPWLGMSIEGLQELDSILLVGSNIRKDQPIAAHRINQATKKNQAKVSVVNPLDFEFYFPVETQVLANTHSMVATLAAIAGKVFSAKNASVPDSLVDIVTSAQVTEATDAIAESLLHGKKAAILLGNIAQYHPQASLLRILASTISAVSDITFGVLPAAANSGGAWLAGAVPHRAPGGLPAARIGRGLDEVLANNPRAFVVMNTEVGHDSAHPAASTSALGQAEFVVSLSSFSSDAERSYSDVILPISSMLETSGTYVNAEGRWQSFSGALKPAGEARPGWKVFRVLGNLAGFEGFEYLSSEQVRDEVKASLGNGIEFSNYIRPADSYSELVEEEGILRMSGDSIYGIDGVVRRAQALQATADSEDDSLKISVQLAGELGVESGDEVSIFQGHSSVNYQVQVMGAMAANTVYLHMGTKRSAALEAAFGPVTVSKFGGQE